MDFDVEVFYDGACPLCMREIGGLRRRDHRARIRFTDIAAAGFDAAAVGLPWTTLMERIHGRLPDGSLIEGVEVFRRLYAAVGFSGFVRLTRIPGVSQVFDLAYHLFAKNRLRLTGRCVDGACEVAGSGVSSFVEGGCRVARVPDARPEPVCSRYENLCLLGPRDGSDLRRVRPCVRRQLRRGRRFKWRERFGRLAEWL